MSIASVGDKMAVRLVALDIDGTLITTDGTLPYDNICAIEEIHRQRIELALTTARTASGAREVVNKLGIPTALVTELGATVIDSNGIVVHSKKFSTEDAVRIIDDILGCNFEFIATADGTNYASRKSSNVKSGAGDQFVYERFDFNAVSRIVVRGQSVEDVKRTLTSQFRTALFETATGRGGNADIVLVPLGSSKGSGLIYLCDYIGISPTDVLAIGDSVADMDMIGVAGVGVAMADGDARLKMRADWIAPSAREGGVAVALKHYGLILPLLI